MSNPVHEGFDSATGTAVSSVTFSVTTTNANDIVSLWASAEDPAGSPHVSSVTSAGLVPVLRKAVTKSSVQSDLGATTNLSLEHWYIAVPAASTISITVTWNITCDAVSVGAIRWQNVFSISDPCDSNASFPNSGSDAANIPPSLTFSTSQPLDVVMYGVACPRLGTFGTGPSFNVSADTISPVSGASSYLQMQVCHANYTTIQSGVATGQYGGGFFTMAGVCLDDAFTASPKNVLQTFVTTICT